MLIILIEIIFLEAFILQKFELISVVWQHITKTLTPKPTSLQQIGGATLSTLVFAMSTSYCGLLLNHNILRWLQQTESSTQSQNHN